MEERVCPARNEEEFVAAVEACGLFVPELPGGAVVALKRCELENGIVNGPVALLDVVNSVVDGTAAAPDTGRRAED